MSLSGLEDGVRSWSLARYDAVLCLLNQCCHHEACSKLCYLLKHADADLRLPGHQKIKEQRSCKGDDPHLGA